MKIAIGSDHGGYALKMELIPVIEKLGFEVADFGGLDTFDHINSYLNAELSDSKVGSKRLHEMVEAGKLGVKSGEGFYDYSGGKADEAIRERDRMYIELAKVLYYKR